MEEKRDKIKRTLAIYTKLMKGGVVKAGQEAALYGVTKRSIQRDIDDIRAFMDADAGEEDYGNTVIFDRRVNGYRMERIFHLKLKNSEVLALCKILLDSRAFVKEEMMDILDRLISCCVPESEQKMVRELIRNEAFHYVELKHGNHFIDKMWKLGGAIRENRYVEMRYYRTKDKQVITRKVQPVAIMFSEYYFYLTAFIEDEKVREQFDVINDSFPTIYRIDRIKSMRVLREHFTIPYTDRFQEGEFRKRIQFMYGGKLQRIRFRYHGTDVDAILDRLPTAEIIAHDGEDGLNYLLEVEVFGKGIEMWLRMWGDSIQIVKRF